MDSSGGGRPKRPLSDVQGNPDGDSPSAKSSFFQSMAKAPENSQLPDQRTRKAGDSSADFLHHFSDEESDHEMDTGASNATTSARAETNGVSRDAQNQNQPWSVVTRKSTQKKTQEAAPRAKPKLNPDLMVIVDGIDRNLFPDRKAIVVEIVRIVGNDFPVQDRELPAGGFRFSFSNENEASKFLSSPYWTTMDERQRAFGPSARAHKPSGNGQRHQQGGNGYSVEKLKVRIDNVLNIFSSIEIDLALRSAGYQPTRVTDFKSNRHDRRPVMAILETEEQAKSLIEKGFIIIFAKRFHISEMREYSKSVPLCRRCQLVHSGPSSRCQNPLRCSDCSGSHFKGAAACPVTIAAKQPLLDKRAVQEAKVCPNCQGQHSAAYGKCPYLSEQKRKSYAAIVADRENKTRAARVEQQRLLDARQLREEMNDKEPEKATPLPNETAPTTNVETTAQTNGQMQKMTRRAARRLRKRTAAENKDSNPVIAGPTRNKETGFDPLNKDSIEGLVAAIIGAVIGALTPRGISMDATKLTSGVLSSLNQYWKPSTAGNKITTPAPSSSNNA